MSTTLAQAIRDRLIETGVPPRKILLLEQDENYFRYLRDGAVIVTVGKHTLLWPGPTMKAIMQKIGVSEEIVLPFSLD